jgi:ABC-type iron transport system FetAB ATPase subunit
MVTSAYPRALISSLIPAPEPTSALDAETSELVERDLVKQVKSSDSKLRALVWITHAKEQAHRVGSRFLEISDAVCHEVDEERAPEV